MIDLSDNKASVKNITSQVSLANGVASWTLPKDISIGRYQPFFTIDGYKVSGPIITVVDKVKLTSVQYAVIQNSKFPTKFEAGKVEYPKKIQNPRQASDEFFVHLSVEASFNKALNEVPANMFFSV